MINENDMSMASNGGQSRSVVPQPERSFGTFNQQEDLEKLKESSKVAHPNSGYGTGSRVTSDGGGLTTGTFNS